MSKGVTLTKEQDHYLIRATDTTLSKTAQKALIREAAAALGRSEPPLRRDDNNTPYTYVDIATLPNMAEVIEAYPIVGKDGPSVYIHTDKGGSVRLKPRKKAVVS